jgi:hypothetical protein
MFYTQQIVTHGILNLEIIHLKYICTWQNCKIMANKAIRV